MVTQTEYKRKMVLSIFGVSLFSAAAGILFALGVYFVQGAHSVSIWQYVVLGGLTGFFISISIASIEMMLRNSNTPLAFRIFIMPMIYSLVIVCIYGLLFYFVMGERGIFEDSYLGQTLGFSLLMTFLIATMETINRLLGQKAMVRLLTGKYYRPVREERFIMFLDLADSTSIAEEVGDEAFHGFIRDFFHDITDPVLKRKAEIYKYVGDEVILTWKKDEGIANNNVLYLINDIVENLKIMSEKYISRYGRVPRYRAGLHFGNVLVGELGVIKMEVALLGDAMNTAARIQAACRENNVDFLMSGAALNQLREIDKSEFSASSIGSISLKGKNTAVELFSITHE